MVARAEEKLPPPAEKAFERGMNAALAEEYGLAAKYFAEAQAAAPAHPVVLFNLGLAHGKAGHELAGIAWLQAYLAGSPQAGNREAVLGEIGRLELQTRQKVDALLDQVGQMVRSVTFSSPYIRDSMLREAAQHFARAGNPKKAVELIALQEQTKAEPSEMWLAYARDLMSGGEFDAAKTLLPKITAPATQDGFWESLAEQLKEKGDFSGARAATGNIRDPQAKAKAVSEVRVASLKRLIETNLAKGDFDPAPIEELVSVLKTSGDSGDSVSGSLEEIAYKQITAKDFLGAAASLRQMADSQKRGFVARRLGDALIGNKDTKAVEVAVKELRAIAESVSQGDAYGWGAATLGNVAEAQLKLGDKAGAKITARKIVQTPALSDKNLKAVALARAMLDGYQAGLLVAASNIPREQGASVGYFEDNNKADACAVVAVVCAAENQPKAVMQVADFAERQIAYGQAFKPVWAKTRVFGEAAKFWIGVGQPDQALNIFRACKGAGEVMTCPWFILVGVFIKTGEIGKALEMERVQWETWGVRGLVGPLNAINAIPDDVWVASLKDGKARQEMQRLARLIPAKVDETRAKTPAWLTRDQITPAIKFLERAGDTANAQKLQTWATSLAAKPAASTENPWLKRAQEVASDSLVVKLPEVLAEAKRWRNDSKSESIKDPNELIRHVARTTADLARLLRTLQKSGRELKTLQ
jgi:tetratricopeptide (TPR) repeat protein